MSLHLCFKGLVSHGTATSKGNAGGQSLPAYNLNFVCAVIVQVARFEFGGEKRCYPFGGISAHKSTTDMPNLGKNKEIKMWPWLFY